MNILVSGATGFVGRILCARLMSLGYHVTGTYLATESPRMIVDGVTPLEVGLLGETTRYEHVLIGCNTVIHLAARVHVMSEMAENPLKEFRVANTLGTINLARQSALTGVKRFVFISTIGVNGDNSGDNSYKETDEPSPHNHYSISKFEAEEVLRQITSETGMEVVIIRAPLVYGPGNPGNFLSLLHVISKGLPLPLASIKNNRSLIYVGNLVDALSLCAVHPAAAGQTYLVSDGEDVSTPELIRRTATALGAPAKLFPFPVGVMRMIGKLSGKSGAVNRLTGSLTVDSSKIRRELGWTPPFTMSEGLGETARWFNETCAEAAT